MSNEVFPSLLSSHTLASFETSSEFILLGLITMVIFLGAHQLASIYIFKRLMRTIKRANIFVAFFDMKSQSFSYFTKRNKTLSFRGLKFKSFKSFLDLFSPHEHDGIRLAFSSLHKQSKPLSIDITTHHGNRNFRLTARRFRGKSSRVIVVLQDISKQEDEKAALRLECRLLTSTVNTYKSLFDHFPTPLWIRQDHEILYFNPACAKIFKASTYESLQNSKNAISTQDLLQLIDDSRAPAPVILQGNRHLFSFQESKIENGLILGYGTDQTRIIEKEKEIDNHMASYKEVLETLSAGVAIYDANQNLSYFNQAYCRMFGFDEKWLTNTPSLSSVLDNLRARRLLPEQAEYHLFKTEQLNRLQALMQPMEALNHLPDGRVIREILSPHPIGGSFFIFEDLSDKISLEQKYNTQLAVQRATLDNLFEGVAVFRSDHRLQFTNSAFLKIWNISPDTLKQGMHLSEVAELARDLITPAEEWPRYKNRVMQIITDRIPKQRLITRKDGIIIAFSYIPLPDGSHLMSYHDVTDKLALEKAYKEKAQAQLKSDRLKSDFISNISYEMRAPLNTIIGYTDLLINTSKNLEDAQKVYCRDIQVSSKRLLNLVNNILDMAMIESGHMTLKREIVDFWSIFRKTIDAHNQQIDPELPPIEFNIPNHISLIFADPHYLQKTLETLLINVSNAHNDNVPMTIDVTDSQNSIIVCLTTAALLYNLESPAGSENSAAPDSNFGRTLIKHILHLHDCEYVEEKNQDNNITVITLPKHASSMEQPSNHNKLAS